jgi:hypothetical protein
MGWVVIDLFRGCWQGAEWRVVQGKMWQLARCQRWRDKSMFAQLPRASCQSNAMVMSTALIHYFSGIVSFLDGAYQSEVGLGWAWAQVVDRGLEQRQWEKECSAASLLPSDCVGEL